ncbi:MAG TPA: tripartite tricarboxylate transporter TctB family protein [Anaeromyxobacter sp.]
MRSWQRLCAVFFLLVSGVVLYQSIRVLRVLDHGQPGSGFMPLGLGIVLAILSAVLFFQNRVRDEQRVRFWQPRAWVQPLVAVAITAVFIVVFDDIGAITSVTVLVAGWLWLVGKKRFVVAAIAGALTGAAVYVVFAKLLLTPFPRGLLF